MFFIFCAGFPSLIWTLLFSLGQTIEKNSAKTIVLLSHGLCQFLSHAAQLSPFDWQDDNGRSGRNQGAPNLGMCLLTAFDLEGCAKALVIVLQGCWTLMRLHGWTRAKTHTHTHTDDSNPHTHIHTHSTLTSRPHAYRMKHWRIHCA